ncbi:MAG: hypothetical protein ABIP97_04885 [Chthoniobacterales bacterium]
MTEVLNFYKKLRLALEERQRVIADREHYQRDPADHLECLKQVSLQIVEITAAYTEPLDPQFKHYLERCSYDKALAWLKEACSSAY